MFIPHQVQGGRFPRYIPNPFQDCHDGRPSAVAGHAVTCQTAQRSFGRRAVRKSISSLHAANAVVAPVRDEREAAARVDGDATRVLELGAAAGAVEEALGAAAGERGGRPGGEVDTTDPVVIIAPDERITAARVDRDAGRAVELGAAAGAVEEASRAAAGERGGRPGGEVDTADTVVAMLRDEREGAARVDRDASRLIELGAAAGAVEEAIRAAAGERGGRPGGDVDTADAVVITVPDEREGAARVDGDAPGAVEPGASAGAVEEATGAAAGEGGGRPGGDFDTSDTVIGMIADEREGAARVDRDVDRAVELGDAAGAVEEASRAAADERGGRPGGDFDTADTVVFMPRDEREGAGRVDGDAKRLIEPGAAAGAVEEASRAAAGEGGGRPGEKVLRGRRRRRAGRRRRRCRALHAANAVVVRVRDERE